METIICSLLTDVHQNTMDQCTVHVRVCVNVHCGMCVCVKIAELVYSVYLHISLIPHTKPSGSGN